MNMRTLKLAVLAIVLALASAIGVSAQQFTLTQTTLSADVTASATLFQLASVTGVNGQGGGNVGGSTGNTGSGGTGTGIYIDSEYAEVISVNTTAKTVSVLRGKDGTKATAHKASTMVLFGNPNAFVTFDPAGTCVVAQVPAQPTINVNNGRQWLCSTITLTWVPGFGNHATDPIVTTLVASAAGAIIPSGPLFHVNGTAAVTGFTIPTGCNATVRGGCQFMVIPDAAFTWTTAGNIAVAGTAVANLAIIFTWDATSSKFIQLQSK
jgi:hypothetical protein